MTKKYPVEKFRNIGIIAHIDAGKTTTTERILYYTDMTYRIGSVDDGTTVTDWMEQERERGITIVSAAVTVFWQDHQINIIDTPGHIDFTAEVQRALRILDGGVVVFDAVQGVEPQSETVWRQADRYSVPRICFINKMDKVGASYFSSIDSIINRLGANPLPMQLPIGEEAEFIGVIDLIEMKAIIWESEDGKAPKETEIPPDLLNKAKDMRDQLIETVAETDDKLTLKYLEGQEINKVELKAALRKATIANKITPVFCGTSLKNKGVQPLLDAIIDYLPSPADMPAVEGIHPKTQEPIIRERTDEEPLSALVFKIDSDKYGRMSYFRVYSGVIEKGSVVFNPVKRKRERINKLIRVYADRREEVDKLYAGDIGAIVGLKDTFTGDTLCNEGKQIQLENIVFPEPVIRVAIEPKTTADKAKLDEALKRLSEEDPTFKVNIDEETGQLIISGMGELHLEILIDRMLREFNVGANIGKPRVSYRETVTETVENVEFEYMRQIGNKDVHGRVVLKIEPGIPGSGVMFIPLAPRNHIPDHYVKSIETGIRESAEGGILLGYPMTDIRVTLTDGSYVEYESSEVGYKVAATMAFREGAEAANPVLLEPVMKVEVIMPEEHLGDVIAQMNQRRGDIQGMEARAGNAQSVRAIVPLIEMFGYATELRSATKGRGVFSMEFDHYDHVAESVVNKMLGI